MSRILIFVLVSLAACGGKTGNYKVDYAGPIAIDLVNQTSRPIEQIFIFPRGNPQRGTSWASLAPGEKTTVKLKEGVQLDDALVNRIKRRIRENTTPRHVPAKVVQVSDIPRTKSGKIVELAVREVVHGRPVKNLEALANPEALEYFRDRGELAA